MYLYDADGKISATVSSLKAELEKQEMRTALSKLSSKKVMKTVDNSVSTEELLPIVLDPQTPVELPEETISAAKGLIGRKEANGSFQPELVH